MAYGHMDKCFVNYVLCICKQLLFAMESHKSLRRTLEKKKKAADSYLAKHKRVQSTKGRSALKIIYLLIYPWLG